MSDETMITPAPPAPPSAEVPPAAPPPEPPRRRRSGAATAGIILIVVGLVFLVGRAVPGVGWWNLWPLIIVIAGVVQAVTPGKEGWSIARLFDGLTTIAFGLVFLAIAFGVVGWSVWGTILSLWPVLVIAIGLDLLGKALGTSWFKVLGSLLVIGGLAYAVSVNVSGGDTGVMWYSGEVQSAGISEPVGQAEDASLLIESGVSKVELTGGGRYLVDATGSSPFGEPDFSVERDSDHADVVLSLGGGSGMSVYPGGATARMEATISEKVLWDITVKTGVSSFEADLRDVPVRSFMLKPGVAECDVTLGDPVSGETGTVEVESGISTVVLEIPGDVEARVESETGLSGVEIASAFEEVASDVWETQGFDEAQKDGDAVWVIRVKSGIGTFRLETY